MEVTITIHLENENMQTQWDLAAALRKLADEVETGGLGYIPIMDVNGNTVGRMNVK